MNSGRSRKGGKNSKHLRNKLGNSNANSNWREHKSNGSNDSNNYGYNNHHLTSALLMLVGLKVQVQKTDGDIYEGILETVSPKVEFSLSCATKISSGNSTSNGVIEQTSGVFVFSFADVVYCKAFSVDLDYGKRDGLKIDSDISRSNGPIPNNNRELVQWEGGSVPDGIEGVLEELQGTDNWGFHEMVREHEEKHGVISTFDSSMSDYQTPIEKSDSEVYREQELRADKMVREMQSDPSYKDVDNIDSGVGEEEMFSSVSRPSPNTSITSNHVPKTNTNTVTSSSSSNSHNVSSNNDGFTTISSRKNNRNVKSQDQTVAPRFRNNRSQGQDALNSPNHVPATRTYSSGSGSHRTHNSNNNTPRNNAYHQQQNYQQQHQVATASSVNIQAADKHVTNNNQSKVESQPPPASGSLLYSTVMKKPNAYNQKTIQKNNVNTPPTQNQNIEKRKSSPPISQQLSTRNNYPQEAYTIAKPQDIPASKTFVSNTSQVVTHTTTQSVTPKHVQTISTQANQTQSRHNVLPSSIVSPAGSVSKLETHDKKILEQKIETSVLNKFGKVIPRDEEKKTSNHKVEVTQLKEFSEQFKLSDSTTKNIKKSPPKTSEIPNRPRVKESEKNEKPEKPEVVLPKEPIIPEIPAVCEEQPPAPVTTNSTVLNHVTTPIQKHISQLSQEVKTSVVAVTTSVVATVITSPKVVVASERIKHEQENDVSLKKSALNPDAKTFSFNPGAKEFTPTSPKPQITRQVSYSAAPTVPSPQIIHHQQSQYYSVQQQNGTPVFVNSSQEMVAAQHTHQLHPTIKQQYYTSRQLGSATVYSIPTGEFNQSQSGQPHVLTAGSQSTGFIPHQNVPNAAQIYLVSSTPNLPMQQVIPQGQHVFPVQPVQGPIFRYVNHPTGQQIPHPANRHPQTFQQHDGGYVFVSQATNSSQHPNGPTNPHQTYPPPSPSPSQHISSGGTPQPYAINQSHPQSNYPHVASPVAHNQTNPYRPPTPQQHPSASQQHQSAFVMMPAPGVHHNQHNIQNIQMAQNNQAIMHNQHHGGILHQYQQQGS